MDWIKRALLCCSVLVMSGCLLPDKYDATITLAANGAYEATLDGEGTMVLAYADYQKPNANKAALDKSMTDFEKQVNDKSYSIKHRGNALFDVKYREDGTLAKNGSKSMFFEFIKLSNSNGTYTIRLSEFNKGDQNGLKKGGLKSVGTICIKTDMTVLEHNADDKPGFFNKCYKWRDFNALSARTIVFKAKA
ncbi:MAG: hypothetical protein H7Z12_13760 [Rhodospirillaceae bacterium]|nr:hypothetical protein [Rhodospirillales bacterium]